MPGWSVHFLAGLIGGLIPLFAQLKGWSSIGSPRIRHPRLYISLQVILTLLGATLAAFMVMTPLPLILYFMLLF